MAHIECAKVLRVFDSSLDCPHCHASQDGWLIDPRDKTHTCDDCNKEYFVPSDIAMDF